MKQGILLVNKPAGNTSFSLIKALRIKTGIKKIGHAGTLDPFATGVMVLLVGRDYTRLSDTFLHHDKEYVATIKLGETTDSYDCDGVTTSTSDYTPSEDEIHAAIQAFQGTIMQTPPMFSAKKVKGKKLYELAREGKEIEREPVAITVKTEIVEYLYPLLKIRVKCTKGTYIRSIGHDLGQKLNCGAHLVELTRTKSGPYILEECIDGELLFQPETAICSHFRVS